MDISNVDIVTEPWEWTKEGCDPETDDNCDFGLDEPPAEILVSDGSAIVTPTKSAVVYEDCSATVGDEDCVESWNIQCPDGSPDVTCLTNVLSDSCYIDDADCQINFLRAFCDKYNEAVCKTSIFERALKKLNGCLPGNWKCTGF